MIGVRKKINIGTMTNAKLHGTHLEFTAFWRHIVW